MGLKEKIVEDLKLAMKNRDEIRTATLRMIRAGIQNKEKERAGVVIDDDAVGAILQKLIRQHKDSIEQFRLGGRNDLVEKEEAELAIIESYLPPRLSAEDISAAVQQVIEETGAQSPRDMGRVMGLTMKRLKETGKMVDGGAVNAIVKQLLEAKISDADAEKQ
jgi:uncharacterized protein YqeY